MIRHVVIRNVNLRILEVILIVLQEIFTENIKISNMTIKLTLHLKKRIELNRNYKNKSEMGYYPKNNRSK